MKRRPHPMLRTRLIQWIAAAIAFAAILFAASRTPRNPYTVYRSRPLDAAGSRLEFVYPAGWGAVRAAQDKVESALLVSAAPNNRQTWWSALVWKLFPNRSGSYVIAMLHYGPARMTGPLDDSEVISIVGFQPDGRPIQTAHRLFRDSVTGCWGFVEFSSSDKQAFDLMRSRICRSVRVLRGPDDAAPIQRDRQP